MRRSAFLVCLLVGAAGLGTTVPAAAQQTQAPERGFFIGGFGSRIGASVRDLREADLSAAKLTRPDGVFVQGVDTSTPAERAGLRTGDIVVEYDGERVRSTRQFTRLVQETPAGRTVTIVVNRAGTRQSLQVVPEEGRFGSIDLDRLRDRIEDGMDELPFGLGQRTAERRLGVTLVPLTSQLAGYFGVISGVLVSSVVTDTPGARAGLKAGDVLTAIDGRAVASPADVVARLRGAAGATLTITLMRDKRETRVQVQLEDGQRRRERERNSIGI
jgi:serine protease Do